MNWAREDVYISENTPIPVTDMGRHIGNCVVTVEGNNIVGSFELNEDLNGEQYVFYTTSGKNKAGQTFIDGIILWNAYAGIEKELVRHLIWNRYNNCYP